MTSVGSSALGAREVVRLHESQSARSDDFSISRTRSEQHVTESATLPSEIEQLPDLEGYLKVASEPMWAGVRVPTDHR